MKSATPATKKSTPTKSKLPEFTKGQKWQMPHGHAEITHVGKTLVQYRFLKTGMIRGALGMKSIPNFAEALKVQKATLMR